MRAADDFPYISRRVVELRHWKKIDPATCSQHSFDRSDNRCIHCNLHYYHLPALLNHKSSDANAASASCLGIRG